MWSGRRIEGCGTREGRRWERKNKGGKRGRKEEFVWIRNRF